MLVFDLSAGVGGQINNIQNDEFFDAEFKNSNIDVRQFRLC